MPEGDDAVVAENNSEIRRTEHLLLDELSDRLETLKLIRTDDEQRADAILEQFGAKGKVESEMLDQLSARAPLQYPDRFEEAHRTVDARARGLRSQRARDRRRT